MDSIFKISKSGIYGILVEGLEKDNGEYLNEETDILISTRNYAYSHTVTLNTLTSISSDGTETFDTYSVNEHCTTCIDSSEFILSKDGLYGIAHIIIPTKVWLDYVIERDLSAFNEYSVVYYYDNEKFYKYLNGVSTEVLLSEILSANGSAPADINQKSTTLIRSDKNTFIMCYINECFNGVCKEVLRLVPLKCSTQEALDFKSLIFKRDLLWTAINAIKYSIKLKQLYEAQRMLEETIFCGQLCNNITIKSTANCGCNK